MDKAVFDGEGRLVSPLFDDIYFAPEDGLAESRHVFIEGNNLPQRFREGGNFHIAEAGFGTGLNFLATVEEWLKNNSTGELTYTGFEMHPLPVTTLKNILANWNELSPLKEEFLGSYPEDNGNTFSLNFPQWRTTLNVITGDINEKINLLEGIVNAWYLDGFAPSKNPLMWTEVIFKNMKRLAAKSTTTSTYSCARQVRDYLSDYGFQWEKAPGYGRKRYMLKALYDPKGTSVQASPTTA